MTRTYIIAAFVGAGLASKAQTRQDLLTSLSEANEAAIPGTSGQLPSSFQGHPSVLAINTPVPMSSGWKTVAVARGKAFLLSAQAHMGRARTSRSPPKMSDT
jgi:hypothetical protein